MEGRGDHRRSEVGLVTWVTSMGFPIDPYKTRIGTHRHIGAYFHADRILDFRQTSEFRSQIIIEVV